MGSPAHDSQKLSGDLPVIYGLAFVDPTIICGKVFIGENVFIGPDAVIRADEADNSGSLMESGC